MERTRARNLVGPIGILPTGSLNSITDLEGVLVGHKTLHEGTDIHTGVTAILPHLGSLYLNKVAAGIHIGNGYGKIAGSTQLAELGEIETPILLTNTLAVPAAMQALFEYTLRTNQNTDIRSINAVVGETNDGILNDITRFSITPQIALQAILDAKSGIVEEGSVGAGSGTIAFGYKGGIGTSSRVCEIGGQIFTVGALVQTNFGGQLRVGGRVLQSKQPASHPNSSADGSVMIILATDAPVSDRNLNRMSTRAMAGLARTGAAFSNGSGDYAIAFSTHPNTIRTVDKRSITVSRYDEIGNDSISKLFLGAIEATEEAILNSLFMANTVQGFRNTIHALPLEGFCLDDKTKRE